MGTTIIWLTVTFLTEPVSKDKLFAFYTRIHPGGVGWKTIAKELPDIKSDSGFARLFLDWLCGVILVYTTLFGIGKIIFADYLEGFFYLLLSFVASCIIYLDLKKRGFENITE